MRLASIACLALMLLVGCASQNRTVSTAVTIQGRSEYERLRLADPRTGKVPPEGYLLALEHVSHMPGVYNAAKRQEDVQAETWQFRGPSHISGRTRALAIDRTDMNILLAGSVGGGIYRSTNAGLTWNRMSRPDQLNSVTSIVQDPRSGHEAEWYYTGGESMGSSASNPSTGVWKSSDGGKSWSVLPSTSSVGRTDRYQFWFTSSIVVHPTASTTTLFLASSFNGILRSTDGGTTWTKALATNAAIVDLTCSRDGILYAGISSMTTNVGPDYGASRSGIWKSTDVGATWTNISPPTFPDDVRRVVVAVAPTQEETLYAVASTDSYGKKSDDERWAWHALWKYSASTGWEERTSSIPLGDSTWRDFSSQGGYDLLLSVSPFDSSVVVLGGTNLYRSDNDFADTTQTVYIGGYSLPGYSDTTLAYPRHYPDQHLVRWSEHEQGVLYSMNDGGIYRTQDIMADTVKWANLYDGYHTSQFFAVNIRKEANDPLLIGGMQDRSTFMTHSFDPTAAWRWREGGDGTACFIIGDGSELVNGTQDGEIYRKLLNPDGTERTWTRVDPLGAKDYLFINMYDIDPNDQRRLYQPGGYILWRNNDITQIPLEVGEPATLNWDSLPATRSNGRITTVSVSTEPANIVWYGTTDGAVYKMVNAHEGSPVPKRVDKGMPSNAFVSCIAFDDHDANNVMVTFSSYYTRAVFHSSDGGETWSDVSSNLRGPGDVGPIVSWARLHHSVNGLIYLLATEMGVFYTHELHGDMTVWSLAGSSAMGTTPARMIRSREADDYIVVGTHGAGVYGGSITQLPPRTRSPKLRAPLNSAYGINTEVKLTWVPVDGAVGYDVEISTSSDFSVDVVRARELKVTQYTANALEQGPIRYYWRVYAYAAGGKSEASETWSFTTAVRSPDLISPANREENVGGLPVQLTWTRIPEALTYDVEVSTNLAFNTIVASASNISDTTVGINGLAGNTRYFWHVRSADADTHGVWCQRAQFTTGVLTSVQDEPEEETFVVSPNPAADKLIFTVPVPTGSVEIVDLDGKVVATFNVTETSTRIDLRTLATGTYTVRYTNGRVTSTRSIQIVR